MRFKINVYASIQDTKKASSGASSAVLGKVVLPLGELQNSICNGLEL